MVSAVVAGLVSTFAGGGVSSPSDFTAGFFDPHAAASAPASTIIVSFFMGTLAFLGPTLLAPT